MKRTLTAVLALALTSTAALAECQPTYVTRWSYEYNSYMTYKGPDVCFFVNADGQPVYQQPIVDAPAPGPVFQQQGYYEDPAYPSAPNAGAALVGGLIGAGIGYAIGHNNNGHKNNYYYYNNGYRHGKHRNNWDGNGARYAPGHKRYLYGDHWNHGPGQQKYLKRGQNND